MYVESNLQFEDDSQLSVHHLRAGHGLYNEDTTRLPAPYAPSIAEPIHFVESWTAFEETFESSIVNEPEMEFYCIFGRDGVSEYGSYSVDNSECTKIKEDEKTQNELFYVHRLAADQGSNIVQRTCVLLFAAMFISFLFCLYIRNRQYFKEKDLESECAPLISRGSDL